MAQLKVPDAPREYATQYKQLLGVDYQADQTQVDRRRSPNMVNMISDFGGNPVKRDGYRIVASLPYDALVTIDADMYGVRATSNRLTVAKVSLDGYELEEDEASVYAHNVGAVRSVFAYQQNIYIISEYAFIGFNSESKTFTVSGTQPGMMSTGNVGESAPANDANIPVTVIALKPDGTAGTAYTDKNLFSIYQTVMYSGDGTATAYTIPNYTKIGSWVKAEVKDANGDWQTVSASVGTSTTVTGKSLGGDGTMQSAIVDPVVTFATAPGTPVITGEDNVRITFAPYSTEQIDGINRGYYNETFTSLLGSDIVTLQNGRMFIASKYKVYYSNVGDMFSISDLAWFEVDNEIMCFTRTSNHLAIITKDNGRNTIFLADETTKVINTQTGETETFFQVRASNAGIGAISRKCIDTLSDEPVFLSTTGLFGILTNWQSEKYAVNRSSRINKRLCSEPDLYKAVGIAWNDYFYIAINGHMYVLDARHKETDRAGNKPLEAYYFDNMPVVTAMYVVADKMYFMDDAYTYTWNNDLPETEKYLDAAHVEDGELVGAPVCAKWSSTFDDDGAPQKLKTLMKKGTMVTIVPHFRSGCEVTLVKDGDKREYLGRVDTDLQTFEYIDFERFSFSTNAVAADRFTKKKIKKYKRLQIIIENNEAEPFGITQITKTYTFGNYAKR